MRQVGFFDQGASKSAKFEQPGDTITGKVVDVKQNQQTVFGSDQLDYWPSGDPKMQVIVTLATADRADPDDDGNRNLYATITNSEGGKFRVIKDAIKKAGSEDIETGSTVTLTYTGPDPQSKNPANPKKLYTATYQKPSTSFSGSQEAPANVNTQTGEVAPQAAAQPTQAAPQPQAAQPTTQGAPDIDKIRQLIAISMTDEQIAAALSADAATIAAVRNAPAA